MTPPPVTLRARAARAGSWTLLSLFFVQALRLGSNVILTRLLVPELFGVMSLALAFIFALTMLSDVGLRQSVVQHASDDDEEFLNTVWTAQIIRGLLIASAGLAIAGGLLLAQSNGLVSGGSAYAHPSLPLAVAIISGTAVLTGLASTNLMTASRQLRVRPILYVDVLAQLVGTIVCIGWAIVSPTILAVTSGAVAAAATRTGASHLLVPGIRNRPGWSQRHYRSIHLLGRWVLFSSVLGFMVSTGDRLLFGGILAADSFGIYAVAMLVVAAPLEVASRLVTSSIYPAMTEAHRSDPASLSRIYYKFRLIVDPIAFFIVGILLVSSPIVVGILFGPRFQQMSEILPILSLSLLIAGQLAAGHMYMVRGHPQLMTLLIFVRLVTLFGLGPFFATEFGIVGAAWAVAAGQLATVPINLFLKARHGLLRAGRELIGFPFLLLGVAAGTLANWAWAAL